MATDIEWSRQALLELGRLAHRRGRELTDAREGFPAEVGASLFGTLKGGAELAATAGRVEKHVDADVRAGKNRLDDVERALDNVERNIRKTEPGHGKGTRAV
ncbi:hypothetical protein ACFYSC_09455 [Streptosporangium sp. NPDC004379]|uniref:hypothetical protein n=1 Tax=Streptosporangium sp. NPDC004379 TaxID=3366189 RepID=UPI0036984B49